MEPVAVLTLVFALLIVATRAPLMFWPHATLDVARDLIEKPTVVRLLGAGFSPLGIGFVITAPTVIELHPIASAGLSFLGWFLIAAALWLLVAPRSYASLALSILASFTDTTALRALGGLGTVMGIALAWLAFNLR